MRDELLQLAERCEAATGPDRGLDVAISSIMHSSQGWHAADCLGEFTRSLDAAMTLVPERWFTKLALEDRHSHSWRWDLRGFGIDCSARAATSALALTAAALRARAAMEDADA